MHVVKAEDVAVLAITEINGEQAKAKVLDANVDVLEKFDAAVSTVDSKTFKGINLLVA